LTYYKKTCFTGLGENMQRQKIQHIKTYLEEQFNLPAEQIEMLLPSFIATLGLHMQSLEDALLENNPTLIGKVGHTIKGAFLNLGLEDCASIALCIEERGKAGDHATNFKQLVEDLRVKLNPVLG
jgi:HPt (histidine-containing phosphotransfer) domain-containing protein